MGVNTRTKIGARAGGLVSVLAIAGLVGVGGASAAEAYQTPHNANNGGQVQGAWPTDGESLTPAQRDELVRNFGSCAVQAIGPALFAGPGAPKAYVATLGLCNVANVYQSPNF